ncbi:hypothetical protein BDK51DRAFT_26356 [Blyttiomyces helicus]|uniref:GON domain-containing protein n=1 Tax=Blyttiomyces helicus TaxID=388810 RepID=A0A4P9WI78_9FUNG|nr:hypothetical protein BDK51DRAFT_26356 [Blyttiomyces helicus]|eukprot:RKO92569.1 hypothetical protein BDK51DRAFT_26356 [Blyttiomyces helicus]
MRLLRVLLALALLSSLVVASPQHEGPHNGNGDGPDNDVYVTVVDSVTKTVTLTHTSTLVTTSLTEVVVPTTITVTLTSTTSTSTSTVTPTTVVSDTVTPTVSITATSFATDTTTTTAIATTVTGTTTLTCATTPAVYFPGPCAQVLRFNKNAVDGNYVVPIPGTSKHVDIYCAGFASGQPVEYLNLTAGYSQNIDIYGNLVQLTFTKARLLLGNPNALYIDLFDLTFATQEGSTTANPSSSLAPISLGEANSCTPRDSAESVIDITGSSFSFVNTVIFYWGYENQQTTVTNTATRIDFQASGFCGGGIVADNTVASECNDQLIPGAIVGPCPGAEIGGTDDIISYPGARNRLLQITA